MTEEWNEERAGEDKQERRLWRLLAFLCLLAAIDSLWLYYLQGNLESFAAACHLAPGFDCAPALRSRYGKIFEISLSTYGIVSYVLFGLMAVQGVWNPRRADRNALGLVILTGAASLFCLWLVYVSKVRLRAYCPYCLILHILTPILFLISLLLWRKSRAPATEILKAEWDSVRNDVKIMTGLVVAIALVVVGLPRFQEMARKRELERNPQYAAVLDGTFPRYPDWERFVEGRPFRGPADAPVTIVEFGDFTCDVCRQATTVFEELVEVYGVKYVFLPYPRSRECNPTAKWIRPGACLAGLAAEYAARRGRFWKFHDVVFEDPSLLREENAKRFLALAGAADTEALFADTEARRNLLRSIKFGLEVGIYQTPTIFINGMGIGGMPPVWFLEKAVENERRRAMTR